MSRFPHAPLIKIVPALILLVHRGFSPLHSHSQPRPLSDSLRPSLLLALIWSLVDADLCSPPRHHQPCLNDVPLPMWILYHLVTPSFPTIESTTRPTLQLALFLVEFFMSTSTPFFSSTALPRCRSTFETLLQTYVQKCT